MSTPRPSSASPAPGSAGGSRAKIRVRRQIRKPPVPPARPSGTVWDQTIRATGIDPIATAEEIVSIRAEIRRAEILAFGRIVT